jgi:hypothetical protein
LENASHDKLLSDAERDAAKRLLREIETVRLRRASITHFGTPDQAVTFFDWVKL